MPITNQTEARDAIYGTLTAALAASTYSALPVVFPDRTHAVVANGAAHLRAFVDLNDERQKTLSQRGSRRYCVSGIVMVQIFTEYGEGQKNADLISGVVKGAFRGVNTGADAIEFRRVRVTDIGQSGSYYQTNVTAEFEYDEIA